MDEVPPDKEILARMLTAERLDRLNSIEFVWYSVGPNMAWENRFKDLMEYYVMNGKWSSQSMGALGLGVNKQRTKYSRKDPNYMKTRAPKVRESERVEVNLLSVCFCLKLKPFSLHVYFHGQLDEVGFEWTPRGNTRMSWDEGFEMLVSVMDKLIHYFCYAMLTSDYPFIISLNSIDKPLSHCRWSLAESMGTFHFRVPAGSEVDKKSDEHRLHKWVESLHDI